jgi:hypothetical protein
MAHDSVQGQVLHSLPALLIFERLPLMPGTYLLDLCFGDFSDPSRDLDIIRDAIPFEVVTADLLGTGMLPRPTDGPVFWPATWTFSSSAFPRRSD